MDGQMWPAERKFLFDAVRRRDPKIIVEVGTWKGGGSTLQIVDAMSDCAQLHTCEINQTFIEEATDGLSAHCMRTGKDFNNLNFYKDTGNGLLRKLRDSGISPDFVFFDGSENPEDALDDFQLLDEFANVGIYLCMHDWDLGVRADGLVSTKATLLRPYLESLGSWRIIDSLTAPVSVGIVLAEKVLNA